MCRLLAQPTFKRGALYHDRAVTSRFDLTLHWATGADVPVAFWPFPNYKYRWAPCAPMLLHSPMLHV